MNITPVTSTTNYNNKIKQNNLSNYNVNTSQPSFMGKKTGKITEFFAKYYGKHIADSDKVRKFSEKLFKLDKEGDVTRHFQTLGSLITSSAYMHATLKNKDMDKDNAITLSVNQALNFLLPTAAAYTVDLVIREINKQLEYRYSAVQEEKISNIADKAAKKLAEKKLSNQLKGFRALSVIGTFTFIYRFVAPVAITPISNAIGRWINGYRSKKRAAKEVSLVPEQSKTVTMSLAS